MAGRIYRKKSKGVKILAATLALALLAPLAVSQPAVHAQAATYSVQEQIVMDALDIDSLAGVDYDLVQVEESNQADTTGVSPFSAQSEVDEEDALAVRINSVLPDGTIKSDFYIPYVETEDGLMNSFAYAVANGTTISGSNQTVVSSTTIKITGYVGKFTQNPGSFVTYYCYKPYWAEAMWTGSTSVSQFDVIIYVMGIKHQYNNATQTMGATVGFEDKEARLRYYSPLKSNYYTSGSILSASSAYAYELNTLEHDITAACEFVVGGVSNHVSVRLAGK